MSAAPSEKRSYDGDITRPGSKVKKKAHAHEVTLPPLCWEPPSLSALFRNVPSDRLSSVVELPRLAAKGGPGKATDDTKWTEKPRLASSLGTHIPIRTADESTAQSFHCSLTGKDEAIKIATCSDKKITTVRNGQVTKPNEDPLTGTEVVQIFAKKRHLRELELYYLKEVAGDSNRPYDLRVVHSSEAGSEHYIFSPNTVLHVTERGYGGLVSLAEWHRESTLWTALQEIQFFRDFRLQKAFTWWHTNVRKANFQRRCEDLQDKLVVAVPQFRNALFLFSRIIEELKGTHRLLQDASRSYTLLEFKDVLINMNQERLKILEELSQCRAVILNAVKEGSHKAHQELQLHMEYTKKPNKICEPIHLHLAHQRELNKELARSESVLQKLGNFAALVNQMIVQSLVTIIRQDAVSFLSHVLKRKTSQQCCLFHTELCFSASSQLTLNPPVHLFQEAVSEAFLTVGDSVIQMCDTCGFFQENSNIVFNSAFSHELTSDCSRIEHVTLTGEDKNSGETAGCRKFCCWKFFRELSSRRLVLPLETSLMAQGNRVHGCYHPLPKRQLEWQISINDVRKQTEKEQAEIMQEAELEIQQLCESYSWLMEIHMFISQWSGASLESMIGQPALVYEEHIKKVRHWTEAIHTVPSSVSTSNQVFTIQCSCIKDNLGQQLKVIEQEVLEQLVEQIKLLSESVVSDLERTAAELKTDPQDLHDFSKYAVMVRVSVKMFADVQKRLEYIDSLQDTICSNYRKMTEQEVTLKEKMMDICDCFIPHLKRADSIVCQRLPSMAHALDTMFSFLLYDLKIMVSKTTSGPFLDPTQNAKEMVSTLNHMSTHVHNLSAKLEQLSRTSQDLQEQPMDLTTLAADVQKVSARKELWGLKDAFTTWLEEWKQLIFSEDVVSQAQGKVSKWKEQALSLTSIIPTDDAVLQETLGNLDSLSHLLTFMAKLQSPTLRHKHWKAILKGMGLVYVPEKQVTVAELMSRQLQIDQQLFTKICGDAEAECNLEQTFHKLQQGWEARIFQLEKFTPPACEPQQGLAETEKPTEGNVSNIQMASQHSCRDARFTITGLEMHFAEIENDLMTLSFMLKSPHSVPFRLQMENMVQSLKDLEKLLYLFERHQQLWTFLTKMFDQNFNFQKVDLLDQFRPVDETFKEIMLCVSSDPHILNFVHFKKTSDSFHGNNLYQILIDGLSTMEGISNQIVHRCGFVSGPCMSGKKKTVVQLGKALGRQVVSIQCCPSMSPGVVQQMMLGALRTGSWLLLDSVDSLTQEVLSLLAQHLVDIHQSFSRLAEKKNQRENKDLKDSTAEGVTGCKNVDSQCQMVIAGKSILASLSYGCVLISSKGYTSGVPESLRYATRPIALTHPDYRIIAEVMLTSIGFTEAMSLSQRLVSLISLAKDSLCLPDFITDNQSCCLVVLQKIISASELHFEQSVKQRKISDEAKRSAAELTNLTSSQNGTARCVETDIKEAEKLSRLHCSHLSVIEGLTEETAIVKAILSVVLPVLYEHKKASQFYMIFRDTFPLACQFPLFQQYIEEEEENQLKDAVTEDLQRKFCHSDSKTISSAVTLYQAIKISQAVLLLGPPGSGKTTCYCALAGALNCLAARAVEYVSENDSVIKGDTPQAEPQIPPSTWNSVDTVVLFPNAMSHEELFGCFCEKRGWQDGAVAKLLRDLERSEPTSSMICNKKSNRAPIVKWLVMDGEPVGQPGWLDYLTTLCGPDNPFLCLSSGETLPSQSHLKLLIETTDLQGASPSAVTRCSLVYFTGTDLWKAVWKSEMDALSSEHKLDEGTVKMWTRLAGDIFASTLSLLRQEALTSAVHNEGQRSDSITYGLQEITSFVRILRALLHHFRKDVEKAEVIQQIHKGADIHRTATDLLPTNLFLVAYIWGFSGHLHPRHWPQFDLLARQVLFMCRYKIVVPDEESVFDHFFNIDSKICPNTLLTNFISPKFGKHTYLLNIMLEANQPVLLAGEPGSGKTTLCRTLLSFDQPHISLPASPLLASRDLRTILSNISCQKNCKDTEGSMTKKSGLLLFVDDLHEAPRDGYGKMSAALETLRQSISKGEIITFDTYNFQSTCSGTISYMATCCIFGLGSHQSSAISSRLSRLFSIFVLPSLTSDVILSVHSPRLKIWLKDMSLTQSGEDMACCIITATKSLYHAVCDQFQPTLQRPHFVFSHHDLEKVFSGLCLWQPNITNTMQRKEKSLRGFPPTRSGSAASVLNIAHLWMHECMRTFCDRLCSEDECKTLVSLIATTAATHYGIRLVEETKPVGVDDPAAVTSLFVPTLHMDTASTCTSIGQSVDTLTLPQEPKPADQSDLNTGQTMTEPSLLFENCHSEEASRKTHPLQTQNLQHIERIIAKLVYGIDLSEALNSINQEQKFRRTCSYRDQDLDAQMQQLCDFIDRKAEDKGQKYDNDYDITTRVIIHRQRVMQLFHILRTLLIPGGHGVLIGSDRGTGRKTTVRLAASVMGCQMTEVHPGNEDKLHEILKEAGNQTRADGVNVIILVHEGISQSVRDELLVGMARRTYPGLCTEEELRNLVSRVTAVKNSRRYLMDSWMFEKYLSQVHRNVHVFMLLPLTVSDCSEIPPNKTTHGWNAQLIKALSVSCCVEVYQPWSHQSLVEVAAQCLKSSTQKMNREGLEAGLSVAMAGIHQSACQYAAVLLRAQPFSPQTYMEFISHFGHLCNHLHKLRQSQAIRVATVLSHLDVMTNTAVQYKQHLIRLQAKVAETQQRKEELLRAAEHQRNLHEEAQETCVVVANKLGDLEEQIKYVQKQVRPVFLSGLKILSCLNPSDLEEVRHYRDPPDGVVKIMDAICLLFNRPPGWESAKQLLGQSNFFQELEFFDRYTLTNEQLQQLGQIVHSPHFVPESVREVSKACESLCRWVQAMYECCCIQHQLLVKTQLEVMAKEARGQLHLVKQHKEDARHHLEDVKLQLLLVQNELEEQMLELHSAESAEREATTAAGQLETHLRDWSAAAQEAELNNETLPGDALILAAIISYLGPFGPDVRMELLSKWRQLCQTGIININRVDPRTSLFTHSDPSPSLPVLGFPIAVSESLQLPLGQALGIPGDAPPARVFVKLMLWGYRSAWVQSWPLLAGTQQHLDISSQSCLITECEMVVCADDPALMDKLDQAAEEGLRVLVTNMERATPSPQFLARLVRPAGCCLPGTEQHIQPTHPEFCLFLATHLPVQLLGSEIHPSILAQVRVVDLCLSSEEIRELMLTQLLQSECKKLLIRHLQLQNDKQSLQEKMVSVENALMDYILQTNTPLLEDPNFLPRVTVCQEAKNKLQTEIQQMSEELEYQESLLAVPRQLMRLAAALYQALQEVSRLSPAYCFSLHGFITVMQEAFIVKGRPLLSFSSGKVLGSIIAEVTNWMVALLLVQYRPCLTKSHFAVLKILVSLALLQHNQHCPEAERAAFLRGLKDTEHSVSQSTTALPSWIPPHIHPELLCLEKIPVFKGLIASLSTCPRQWQEYLHLTSSSVAGAVPCRSHSHLSLLQRALLWKTMLPECLEGLADAMAVYPLCLYGQTAENEAPHTGNPEALSRYLVRHEGPIILTVPSPRENKWTSIQPLHLIHNVSRCVADKKEVQVKVVSLGAPCDTEFILSMLDRAVNAGHWLVFNNCHLLEQWDDQVVTHLSRLISSFREKQCRIHPCFRLWFVTHEYASCSIPAAVRMCALPLLCDSPWSLTEELSCSLRQVVSIIRCQSLSAVTADYMELLLRCAIFHSVLLQRQSYEYLSQEGIYNWSQEDLLVLMDAHITIAGLCHDKTRALQYIAVSLVHGAHVLDSADLEVVESLAKICLSTVSPLGGKGPQILLDFISDHCNFDLTGLLQNLEQGFQDTATINDPVVLGVSADVAAERIKINSHNLNVLLQASQTPLGPVRSFCIQLKQPATLPAFSHAIDRLQTLKTYLEHQNDSPDTNAGAVSRSPLRDFLQAEWDDLIDSVSSLLSQLQQPVQYSTPTSASLLKLANLSHLERRAELLGAYLWHHNTADPPGGYRLSSFNNARGFLVAVIRQAAQMNHKYTSDIALHFEVLSDSAYPASLPADAVYLCGLELRGASWDTQLGAIEDTVSPQPCSLPLVCVKAQVRSTKTARDASNCESSHLSCDPQLPLYHCPLYLDGERESVNSGLLADVNIITILPLSAKLNPVLCSFRRVRLVSVL
ncbi:dynein heavy chain domain-containing protein 1-like isoform X4 [Acanthopagrus latus]|uniref:dynein heavy chain domain-containing protein 1-like isoform X4 n=1 Tax=Acanthopagrus latus TaxID=8177 RepID=UPI00187CEA24|nr:dynein heavy chain domain-containing protein 1-like isoform X4 [Acanthopagrus latus]